MADRLTSCQVILAEWMRNDLSHDVPDIASVTRIPCRNTAPCRSVASERNTELCLEEVNSPKSSTDHNLIS